MNNYKSVYTNLVVAEEGSLPDNPKRGQIVFVNNVLQMYVTVDGVAGWIPLTNQRASYVHQQAVAKLEWLVDHGLASDHLMYAAYDGNGELMIVNKVTITNNLFKLSFGTPQSGYVIVMSDNTLTGVTSDLIAHMEQRLSELDLPNIIKYEETDSETGEESIIYDFKSLAVAS